MKLLNRTRLTTLLGSLALVALVSAEASAATLSLQLARKTLTNVDDAAGRWQHEGGDVLYNSQKIGKYAAHRRVTLGGTDEQNTAMLTVTIFLNGAAPPRNLTLQGAHDFSSGRYIGSVSAASSTLSVLNGATFTGSSATGILVLTY